MAAHVYSGNRRVVLFYLLLVFLASVLICAGSEAGVQSKQVAGGRRVLGVTEEDQDLVLPKKKPKPTTNSSPKNQTKLPKSNLAVKNQTKLIKSASSSKNQTKVLKRTNSTKNAMPKLLGSSVEKFELKKLNSTTKIKKLNSTSLKPPSNSTKSASPKTKSPKAAAKKVSEPFPDQKQGGNKEQKSQKKLSRVDPEDDEDLVSEFRDLPAKFQQTLLPDLERISTTSRAYLTKANKQITRGFKPYVGNKYAPNIATVVSFAFILFPLLLISLLINRIKAHFSLQKLLIFVQVYLAIYFSILCLSSLTTGLEPLKFFYATSQSAYVCIQIMQTLGYVMYLLLLVMYLVLVFSTDCGLGLKFLGLAQTFVGYAVGLHYYVAVFHRMVLRQPPRTNWKVHGIYAVFFLAICIAAQAERRKKAYVQEGGEEGKKS